MRLGTARKTCGEIGGIPERESRQVGRGGKCGPKKLAHLRRLGEERRGRSKIRGVMKRPREALENVGPPGGVINAREFGNALNERRYAALVSDCACS